MGTARLQREGSSSPAAFSCCVLIAVPPHHLSSDQTHPSKCFFQRQSTKISNFFIQTCALLQPQAPGTSLLSPTPSLLGTNPSNLFHLDLNPHLPQHPQAPGTPLLCPSPSLLNINPSNLFHADLFPHLPVSPGSWDTPSLSQPITTEHKTLQPFPCRSVPSCPAVSPSSRNAPALSQPPCPVQGCWCEHGWAGLVFPARDRSSVMSVCFSCLSRSEEPHVAPSPCLWSCKRSSLQQQWRLGRAPRGPSATSFAQAAIRAGGTRRGAIPALRRLRRALISTSLTLQFDNFTRQGLLWGLLLHSPVADGVSQSVGYLMHWCNGFSCSPGLAGCPRGSQRGPLAAVTAPPGEAWPWSRTP